MSETKVTTNGDKVRTGSAKTVTPKTTQSRVEPRQKETNRKNHSQYVRVKRSSSGYGMFDSKTSIWWKMLLILNFVIGISIGLLALSNGWFFLGLVGLVVPLLFVIFMRKEPMSTSVRKVFFTNLLVAVMCGIFWPLSIICTRFGIGFLATVFRALQIGSAFLGSALIIYLMIEYVSGGKTTLKFVDKVYNSSGEKMQHVFSKAK